MQQSNIAAMGSAGSNCFGGNRAALADAGSLELGPGPSYPLLIGKYDFEPRKRNPALTKNDLLEIVFESAGDWRQAISRCTGLQESGYAPRNYVVPVASLEAEE